MAGPPLRQDLLELTPEALMALANPGFVKRALKELASGPGPDVEADADGTVRARYADGHCATLAPGRSLREAACSCPASGLCRHRVTLVLAYQRQASGPPSGDDAGAGREPAAEPGAWTPAGFSDADLAALAAATLEQADRLAAARPAIRVTAWSAQAPVPTAYLPMCTVRFFSRASLVHARCDCARGSGCAHVVLAVRAYRQAGALQPGQDATVELAPVVREGAPSARRIIDTDVPTPLPELDALLLQLWLDGSSQPPLALEARLGALRAHCQEAGWCWMVDAVDELEQLLAAQHQRASSFDPLRLLQTMAELPARLLAARQAERLAVRGETPPLPAGTILGVGVAGEVALDHLRLVSLGAQCWQGDDAQGVRIAFADPDSQGVTVLDRSWPTTAGQAPGPVMARRVSGYALRRLACGQLVTKGARRRANGRIEIATGVRQTSLLPLGPGAWDALDVPLRQPGARALAAHLAQAHPDFVRPRQAIEHLHVLPVARVLDQGWDGASQVLHARLATGEDDGDAVHLVLQHRTAAPGAVDAMAGVLAGSWGEPTAVAGLARIESGRLLMQPLSFLTRQRAVVLEADEVARQALAPRGDDEPQSPLDQAVQETFDLLASWLRLGLRHQGGGSTARGLAQADALRRVGLARAGTQLQRIVEQVAGSDRGQLPARLGGLVLLLDGVRRSTCIGRVERPG